MRGRWALWWLGMSGGAWAAPLPPPDATRVELDVVRGGGQPPLVDPRGRVLAFRSPASCCLYLGVTAELLEGQQVVQRWPIDPREDAPASDVTAAQRHLAAVQRLVSEGGFVAMTTVLEPGAAVGLPIVHPEVRVELVDDTWQLQGAVGTARVPRHPFEVSSDCCDGGLGRGATCTLPGTLQGLWVQGRHALLAQAVSHPADGCEAGPVWQRVDLVGASD